jgi:hypothetical protein
MFVPHRRPSTSCYGDSFTLFYVDYVRTSQETPPLPVKGQLYFVVSRLFSYLTGDTSAACYGEIFAYFYIDYVRTSQEALHVLLR